MSQTNKRVSIMCFHDELCQVYNALMTALSLLRAGAQVTIFFGSRGERRSQGQGEHARLPSGPTA